MDCQPQPEELVEKLSRYLRTARCYPLFRKDYRWDERSDYSRDMRRPCPGSGEELGHCRPRRSPLRSERPGRLTMLSHEGAGRGYFSSGASRRTFDGGVRERAAGSSALPAKESYIRQFEATNGAARAIQGSL